jgi:tight adherence protein B
LAVLTLAITAMGASLGLLFFGPVLTIVLTGLGLFSPSLLVTFYRHRRVRLIERQLVDALSAMAGAMRAGMTLYQGMEEVASTSQPPLSQELSLTVREMRLGTPTEEAMENLAGRVDSDDLRLVVTSVNTARTLGANMAEMFDTISDTIRDRFRMEGRIRSLTAQGKLQGIVMGGMPIIVWIGFDLVRPDLTRPMMDHWFGVLIVALVVVMEILGAFFIRRVIAIKV